MKKENMTQDRRDAIHWAEEWRIRQRRNKIIIGVAAVLVIAMLGFLISFVSVRVSRTMYSSEEEMKAALQGRFETDYAEDIVIDGDTITLTYYNQSHYDLEYAERYGYSEYEDSVYEDDIVEWDYRRGEIKCSWMDSLYVDKDGNLVYLKQAFRKTDNPKPTPIDPSELSLYKKGYNDSQAEENEEDEAAYDDGLTSEEALGQEAAQESKDETQEAAEDAGIDAYMDSGAESDDV